MRRHSCRLFFYVGFLLNGADASDILFLMLSGFRKASFAFFVAFLLVPPFASAATFERPLEKGMSGSDVSALQTLLKEKGFFNADVTGYYGQVTLQAVADFQKSQGLESLGYVGPATRAILNGEVIASPTSSDSIIASPSPSPSFLSSLITQLQQLLRNAGYYAVSLTGMLDQATIAASESITTGAPSIDAPKRSGGHKSSSPAAVPAAPSISDIDSSVTQTTATITWTTDEPSDSRVDFGTTTSYGTASTSATLVTSHSITLTGLTAFATYHFRVRSADAEGNATPSSDLTFTTGEDDLEPLLLKKLRSDYDEFVVYAPLGGTDYVRWFFSERLNPGLAGPARMRRASIAKLYASFVESLPAANSVSGTQATSSKTSQGTSAGSRTGTFVGPATNSGVTDIIYSQTPGDRTTYTVTIDTNDRIVWRTLGQASGAGIAAITIKTSGVEISSEHYAIPLTGGERQVNLTGNSSGIQFVALATGLPAGTYTVDIAVSSSNPVNGRVYDGGMQTYPSLDRITTKGLLSSWQSTTLASQTVNRTLFPGGAIVYPFTGTKIDWRAGYLSTGGIVRASVYDQAGTLVTTKDVDTYSAGTSVKSTPLASGLDKASYVLTLEGLPTKNASSTGYRVYDGGLMISDETQVGTLGVDEFDDMGQDERTTPETIGNTTVIGVGNIELAVNLYKQGSDPSASAFIGGTHGHETGPADLVISMDGAPIDYASAANGTTWIGDRMRAQFSTMLTFAEDSSKAADVDYDLLVTSKGYIPDVTRTLAVDSVVKEDYALMLVGPDTSVGNAGADGGFELFGTSIPDPDATAYTAHTDSTHPVAPRLLTAAFYNDSYGILARMLNMDEVDRHYADPVYQSNARETSSLQERSDGYIKYYLRPYAGTLSGVPVPAGDVYRTQKIYQVVKR